MPPRVPSAPPVYPRANRRAGGGVGLANRLGGTDRLCETLSSWRLLVGGLSPGASHHSFTTSSEEPPLSNFNSYGDPPEPQAIIGLHDRVLEVLGELLRHLGNGESGELCAELVYRSVERVSLVAPLCEEPFRVRVERFSARPILEPGEPVGVLE